QDAAALFHLKDRALGCGTGALRALRKSSTDRGAVARDARRRPRNNNLIELLEPPSNREEIAVIEVDPRGASAAEKCAFELVPPLARSGLPRYNVENTGVVGFESRRRP